MDILVLLSFVLSISVLGVRICGLKITRNIYHINHLEEPRKQDPWDENPRIPQKLLSHVISYNATPSLYIAILLHLPRSLCTSPRLFTGTEYCARWHAV